jgi:putative ABC transport system permease protein
LKQGLSYWRRHSLPAIWLIAALGLAIGVATAAWSVAYAVWYRPLPAHQPDRLVSVGYYSRTSDVRSNSITIAELHDWKTSGDVFADVAGIGGEFNSSTEDGWFLERPEALLPLEVTRVTVNFLDVLGVTPLLGRSFRREDGEPGAPEVAVISHRLWQSAFGASPDAVGRRVTVSVASRGSRSVQVVGVLPPGLTIPARTTEITFLVGPPEQWRGAQAQSNRVHYVSVVGRLRAGMSLEAAASRLTAMMQGTPKGSLAAAPLVDGISTTWQVRTRTASVIPLQQFWYGTAREWINVAAAACVLVVLVACANALGVLLALASRRSKEMAVRSALGGSPVRLRCSLVMELLPIGIAVAGLSIVVAQALIATFLATAPSGILRLHDAHVDWKAGTLAMLATLAAVAGSGLVSAFIQTRRRDILVPLQTGSLTTTHHSFRSRQILITAQVASALGLVTATGLVAGSFHRLLDQPLGFDIDRVLSIGIIATRPYFSEPGRYLQFIDDVHREVAAAPGQRQVAVTTDPPLATGPGSMRVTSPDGTFRQVVSKPVSDGFFGVMGIPMLAGRDFRRADRTGCTVIVNSTFARTFSSGVARTAGSEVTLGGARCTIIGVVGDVRDRGLADAFVPVIYPLFSNRMARRETYLVSRESGSMAYAMPHILDAIKRVDPTAYVTVRPLSDRLHTQTSTFRMAMVAFGTLAAFTVFLACLGVAATVAQLSTERHRELAIRRALGASARSLMLLMTRFVAVPLGIGLILGAIMSSWVAPLIGRFLFQTTPLHATVWGLSSIVVLTAATGVAAWLPARRVQWLDPAALLRRE